MAQINVNVDDPDDRLTEYGAGAKVRLERATTSSFADATEIDSKTIVSGQSQYEFFDLSGTATSWYRSRYSASAGAPFSDYSDPFQAGAPSSYASLDELVESFGRNAPTDTSQLNRLSDLLTVATEQINAECDTDFFRHPAISGTEVRTYGGISGDFLMEDIVSLDSVAFATSRGGTYTALAATDYYLDPQNVRAGWPYDGLYLSGDGAYSSFANYWIRLTGVFGWPAVPADVRQACIERARQLFFADQAASGGTTGPDEFGNNSVSMRLPDSMWRVKQRYSARRRWLVV